MPETIFKEKRVNPFDIMCDCGELLNESSDIRFNNLPVEDFYDNLEAYPDGDSVQTDLAFLNGSFCACLGGVFRSTRMARYLEQKGIKLADRKCRNGYKIDDVPEIIDKAIVDSDGVLKPVGFDIPMANLFIGITSETESCEGCLLLLLNSLLRKQKNSQIKIKLNIYLVEGDESTSATFHRRLRAFDPDLDNPDTLPVFKGI